jgi:flagellar secretion chaperone FliS
MNLYQRRALEGASGIELTIALYDGMTRFLRDASKAVIAGDVEGRRAAAKRTIEILIHLQSTLRMDIGGTPAECLSNFYAATLALVLQGSVEPSAEKFNQAIANIWTVREAWRQAASGPETPELMAAELQVWNEGSRSTFHVPQERGMEEPRREVSWTA